MEKSSLRDGIFLAARTTILLLLVGWFIYWFVTRPKPVAQMTVYIGDPSSACAYPLDSINSKKLNWADEDGTRHSWEEFQSLEAAKSAGYRLCH